MTDPNHQTEVSKPDDPAARARAIQSLLIEKGLLSTDAVDRIISLYEEELGPMNGKQVVARAWSDPAYKTRLLDEGVPAIAEVADVNEDTIDINVVENTPDTHNLIVCTLCSCYPWAVLGLPPRWYKSPAYRSKAVREPRALLRDQFDCEIDRSVSVEVWDSNSELRYMVLPQRPSGTDGLTEAELADLVTRDVMIGVDRFA